MRSRLAGAISISAIGIAFHVLPIAVFPHFLTNATAIRLTKGHNEFHRI